MPADKLPLPDRLILDLAEFDYLTTRQLLRVEGYADSSLTYVQEAIKSLLDANAVFALRGRAKNLPWVYTLTGTGRQYAAYLGQPTAKRFRPFEENRKAGNLYFIQHTLLINDVLIAARLLAQTEPRIVLTRLYIERALRRKIYVALPEVTGEGESRNRKMCIEPDAGVRFQVTMSAGGERQTWEDFYHVEVYRNLPPVERRFKQKVQGYVASAAAGQLEALFHTTSLNIVVFAQTVEMAETLREWTEEALPGQPDEGGRFFFSSIDIAKASPTEIFLSPVWQQAFGTATTPLLVLE
jgi:hypothetical protein